MRDLFLSALLAIAPADAAPAEAYFMPNMILAHDGEMNAENCHPGRTRGRIHCHDPEEITELVEE